MSPLARLLSHQRTLERVIAEDADPWTTNAAKRWLGKVREALKAPPLAMQADAGLWGVNGHAAAIEDIACQADTIRDQQRAAEMIRRTPIRRMA